MGYLQIKAERHVLTVPLLPHSYLKSGCGKESWTTRRMRKTPETRCSYMMMKSPGSLVTKWNCSTLQLLHKREMKLFCLRCCYFGVTATSSWSYVLLLPMNSQVSYGSLQMRVTTHIVLIILCFYCSKEWLKLFGNHLDLNAEKSEVIALVLPTGSYYCSIRNKEWKWAWGRGEVLDQGQFTDTIIKSGLDI